MKKFLKTVKIPIHISSHLQPSLSLIIYLLRLQYFFWFCDVTVTVPLPLTVHRYRTLLIVTDRYWPFLSVTDRYLALLSVTERFFSVTERFFSVTERCFSVTERFFSVTECFLALITALINKKVDELVRVEVHDPKLVLCKTWSKRISKLSFYSWKIQNGSAYGLKASDVVLSTSEDVVFILHSPLFYH